MQMEGRTGVKNGHRGLCGLQEVQDNQDPGKVSNRVRTLYFRGGDCFIRSIAHMKEKGAQGTE